MMRTKHFFIVLYSLFLANTVIAQREKVLNLPKFDQRKFHYGFYLGMNNNDFKIAYKPSDIVNPEVVVEPSIGFNVGLIGDLRLHKNINLRFEPGLISNTKTLAFKYIKSKIDSIRDKVGNTYLHLPLILKISTDRLNNIRPYVLGGISYDHNFDSNEKNTDDNSSGVFRQQSNNFMYEIGLGIDIYLPYFKFSPSIRGIFAITNEIKYDNTSPSQWTDPIDFMGTRGVFLHLSFE